MGIYVNPGNAAFGKVLNADIYVDKTELITYTNDKINKPNCFICVSRPRRFGKSMAADMLVAYYSRGCDSSGLFAGRKVEQEQSFGTHLNRHYVIRLDVQRFVETKGDLGTFIHEMERAVIAELVAAFAKDFPECKGISCDTRLKVFLDRIYALTKQGFIFIIDEWDCIFRMAKGYTDCQQDYLSFLRGLFKGAEYVDLAYMTGILPIKKYGEHSAINIFDEYSMTDPKDLGRFFGFTDEEVKEQCGRRGVDYEEMAKWYDGYLVGGTHIYNPKSVVDALRWDDFHSYWTGTETYEALKVYIDRDYDGLKQAVTIMLGNERCRIDPVTFQNDMTTFKTKDDVLTLLVHLGYLTYDRKTKEVFIPNLEIAQEFMRAMRVGGWENLMNALNRSEELLNSTWALDEKAVAKGVAAIHNETASILQYNNENSLACALHIAYYSAQAYYTKPIKELPTGKGFADVVYLPLRNTDRPALVIELKWNKSAVGAIRQIKNKEYANWVQDYTGDILLVGINYDKKKDAHSCVIERFSK